MSKQLKPVIRYGAAGNDLYPFQTRKGILFLCLPLTPASRKRMIEAMAKAIGYQSTHPYDKTNAHCAEAALSALEKMAGDTK
jgi:hypothetical protein